jgi:hypothetical protein
MQQLAKRGVKKFGFCGKPARKPNFSPVCVFIALTNFLFNCVVACACLAEQSDATRIKTSTRHDLKLIFLCKNAS